MAQWNDFDKLSFLNQGALFSQGDRVWLFWGTPQYSRVRPDALALLIQSFYCEGDDPWVLFPYVMEFEKNKLEGLFKGTKPQWTWVDSDRQSFDRQFELCQKMIQENSCEKIVPWVEEESSVSITSEQLEYLIASALRQDRGFVYGYWGMKPGEGVLGVTPEILVTQKSEYEFETMALAGTTSMEEYESDPNLFINDPKEKEEHLKVLDHLVDQLESMGQLGVSETGVLMTPHLVHLHTPLFLKTQYSTAIEKMIEKLHPTPALGCFPKKGWRSLLKKIDDNRCRGSFGAPLTISFSTKKSQTLVSIRNIQWNNEGKVSLKSGCGLVKSSRADREWDEIKNKRNSVKKMLGLE